MKWHTYAAYKSLRAFIKYAEVIRYFILPAINLTVNYDTFYYTRAMCIVFSDSHKGNNRNASYMLLFEKNFQSVRIGYELISCYLFIQKY